MSLLSTKLRWYIEESGYTVYQLAKLTGVDRTSIQKTLSGQRLISEESMMRILKYLHLTTREREELLRYYEISKVGDNIYFRREYIRSIIEGIALVRQVGSQEIDIHGEVRMLSGLDQENQLFAGEYAVINLLRVLIEDEVFNQEKPELGIYIPLKEEFLNHIFPLYQLDGQSIFKKLSVTQLLRLTKTVDKPEDSHYNLRILNMILPYSLAAGAGYKVYYY